MSDRISDDPSANHAWREAYAKRIVEVTGISIENAREFAEAAEVDLSYPPEDSADDEMEYWTDDGDDE